MANLKYTQEDFINISTSIHNNFYDYSKVEYTKIINPVLIICPTHGEFWQRANLHIKGTECPKCSAKKNKFNPNSYNRRVYKTF